MECRLRSWQCHLRLTLKYQGWGSVWRIEKSNRVHRKNMRMAARAPLHERDVDLLKLQDFQWKQYGFLVSRVSFSSARKNKCRFRKPAAHTGPGQKSMQQVSEPLHTPVDYTHGSRKEERKRERERERERGNARVCVWNRKRETE